MYKFMNNALYCKTMEKLKNRTHMRVASNEKDCLKWLPKRN